MLFADPRKLLRLLKVVLDDEEGQHSHFSYGKYFGFDPLSGNDEKNIGEGKDSVLG